jgi:outer membrane receptor for ferrienterochelin and colicin
MGVANTESFKSTESMKPICFVLAWYVAFPSLAQTVSGTIKDEKTNLPLEGVVVRTLNTNSGVISDSAGFFQLISSDSAFILSYVGYITDTLPAHRMVGTIYLRTVSATTTVEVVDAALATRISLIDAKNLQVISKKELCKAACCNLSESFETNASVDGSFTDAITGTRQIRMLGLEGYYSQITLDNIPNVRGLAGIYGLGYIPGPWVDAIYLSKGVGSVTSGYESITGQINVATKNTSTAERLHINAYTSNSGRQEINAVFNPMKAKDTEDRERHHNGAISTSVLAHGAFSGTRADMNGDGFLDNPLFTNMIFQNDWSFEPMESLTALVTCRYLNNSHTSGQLDFNSDNLNGGPWGVYHTTERFEAHTKVGYIFNEAAERSVGSQFSYINHASGGTYGLRSYNGAQETMRGHLLFSNTSDNGKHQLVVGATYVQDVYDESLKANLDAPLRLNSISLKRREQVAGAFCEYTFKPGEKLTLVAGARADQHNLYGLFYTPRIHIRWSLTERSAVKCVSGSGRRVANPIMDNVGFLGGNRNVWIVPNHTPGESGLKMEEAWNNGIIWVRKGKFLHRDQTMTIDVYHTRFVNQTVIDYETPGNVYVYNLQGNSFSNSIQAEWHFSPARRFDVRVAYRWLEARTQYGAVMKDRPLMNKHRAFINVAYETKVNEKGRQFRFDSTLQWIGKKRRPAQNDSTKEQFTPAYFQWMAQATWVVKSNFEFYLGGENLGNFRITDAITDFGNAESENFDGSQSWGPVFGAMGYLGLRFMVD